MSKVAPVVLQDYDRVQRPVIVLQVQNALRRAEDCEGDLKEVEAAAKAVGEVSGVPEPSTGYTALRRGDRWLIKKVTKRALVGAKVSPDSEEGQAIAAAVQEGYYDGATNPRKLIVVDLPTSQARLELGLEREVEEVLLKRAARRRADEFEQEQAAEGREPADIGTLEDLLERPDESRWCIDGLLPAGGRVTLVAPNKAGKTTMNANLIRSLLTGEPFLGRFAVEPFEGNILFLNFEVSAATMGRWLADQGFTKKQTRRIHVANLRGTDNPLSSEPGRAQLAEYMREHSITFLIVDPFGRAYTGDQDSNSQVAPWLTMLDQVATEGGAREVVLTVHAGWGSSERGSSNQVRARGASALADWPDAIWRLSRNGDTRFFEAEGRDVLVDEDQLDYDPETRRLTLAGVGGRQAARRAGKTTELAEPILAIVQGVQGIGSSGIGDALRMQGIPFSKGDESAAITALVTSGALQRFKDGRLVRHYTPGKAPDKIAGVTTL